MHGPPEPAVLSERTTRVAVLDGLLLLCELSIWELSARAADQVCEVARR